MDEREAHDLIEAILQDEDLRLTRCERKSERRIAEGPKRVLVQRHACTRLVLHAETASGVGDGSSGWADGPLTGH
jgi:hypothetical protein